MLAYFTETQNNVRAIDRIKYTTGRTVTTRRERQIAQDNDEDRHKNGL